MSWTANISRYPRGPHPGLRLLTQMRSLRHRCGTSEFPTALPRGKCKRDINVSKTPPQLVVYHEHVPQQSNMARNSRWANSPLRALTLALCAQLSFVHAQVAEIEKASNDSLLWGPYRPNLYFGVRPRIPKSLMGGLMWTKVEDHTVQHSKSQSPSMASYMRL